MLAILSAVFGFAAPFIPELLRYFTNKQDNQHELAMLDLRLKMSSQEHAWRMEEISASADIAESEALHKPQESFGVQILDKAHDSGMPWFVVWPVFWGFAVADWVATMIRPSVTVIVVTFWGMYKYALYTTLTGARFEASWDSAITQIWTADDMSVVIFVLTFWFGQRAAKGVFGGNASHGGAGK